MKCNSWGVQVVLFITCRKWKQRLSNFGFERHANIKQRPNLSSPEYFISAIPKREISVKQIHLQLEDQHAVDFSRENRFHPVMPDCIWISFAGIRAGGEETGVLACFAESFPELKYFFGCKSFCLIQGLVKLVWHAVYQKKMKFLYKIIPVQHK